MRLDNRFVVTGLQVGLGALVGMTAKVDRNRAVLAANFGASLLMNLLSYRVGHRVAFAALRARPAPIEESPRLHRIVEDTAERAGMEKPAVYTMGIPKPNAFATESGHQAAIGASDALMKCLDDEEVAAVVAHELAHIKNRDRFYAALGALAASGATMVVAALRAAAPPEASRKSAGWRDALAVASMAGGVFLTLYRARGAEIDADLTGARICGRPDGMISALQKLEDWKPEESGESRATEHRGSAPISALLNRLLSLLSPHPSVPERVRRLREAV